MNETFRRLLAPVGVLLLMAAAIGLGTTKLNDDRKQTSVAYEKLGNGFTHNITYIGGFEDNYVFYLGSNGQPPIEYRPESDSSIPEKIRFTHDLFPRPSRYKLVVKYDIKKNSQRWIRVRKPGPDEIYWKNGIPDIGEPTYVVEAHLRPNEYPGVPFQP